MFKQKPETLALTVALAGTLTVLFVFLTDLVVARNRDLDTGERRLQHFGLMMAEHTARTFEAVDVLLRETAADLPRARKGWENWTPQRGYEYIAQRHSRAMPQLRDLIIFDRHGNQRFISTYFPAPHINVKDRPYFVAVENGADSATYGPYIGRNSGRYTYALARRIDDEQGKFSGVMFGAMEPAYLQDFCWANRLSDDSEAVLVNAREEIIASCRPTDLSRQSPVISAKASAVLYGGTLGQQSPASGLRNHHGYLISAAPVPGFADLRIVTAIPERTLLAGWYNRLYELGTLATLVTVVLLVGGLMIRRQVREMADMTSQLAESHDLLEERVRTATLELGGQKEAAERANTAKSRFLAAASHDLRQPLHALSLFSTDLQRQLQSGNTQGIARLAEQIATSTSVLGELLDSLLDISRLDVAGIKPDIRAFALQPMFERLAVNFRRAAADRNITLRFRPTPRWVASDPVMFERMVANLVSNAIRYTPPGGRVLVGARRRLGRIAIEVRDNGIGIAPEHQAAIFAEFYQVGNPAREHDKGLGLGLSIVDRLARALGIEVTLRSRRGSGTTFALQVNASQPVASAASIDAGQAGKVHCVGGTEELLGCVHLLERWHYAVSVEDGTSMPSLPTDAVMITDSPQTAARIAESDPTRPLIVLVDEPGTELPAGAHLLPTPVRPAKLRALVAQLQKTLSKSIP